MSPNAVGIMASGTATSFPMPTFRNFTDSAITTATSITATKPTGAAVGDFISFVVQHSVPITGVPSGAVLIGSSLDSTVAVYGCLYAGLPAGSWTFTKSGGSNWRVLAIADSGGSAADGFQAATNSPSGSTVTFPALTTTHDNCLMHSYVAATATLRTFTDPCPTGATTILNDSTNVVGIGRCSLTYHTGPVTAGSYASVTGSASGSTVWNPMVWSINP